MTKPFRIKISRIFSFKSCRSKDPSDLPFNPVRRKPPPFNSPSVTVPTTVPQRRRSSFRLHVLTAFGCGTSTPSLSPPHTPTFQWHVIAQVNEDGYETPRRKIYDAKRENKDPRRSGRYVRRRGSIFSAEEYEEETERESLLASPENSSSEVQSVTRGRRHPPKKKKTSADEESLSSTAADVIVEGVAVVKRSEDPYEDFKGSMMEMIVEKNMSDVADLEQLLRCFLTLNAKRHHRAIVKAFSEVWVALFSGGNEGGSRRSSVRLSDYDDC